MLYVVRYFYGLHLNLGFADILCEVGVNGLQIGRFRQNKDQSSLPFRIVVGVLGS